VTPAATAVCCCCRRGSACRYDCLCFLVLSMLELRTVHSLQFSQQLVDSARCAVLKIFKEYSALEVYDAYRAVAAEVSTMFTHSDRKQRRTHSDDRDWHCPTQPQACHQRRGARLATATRPTVAQSAPTLARNARRKLTAGIGYHLPPNDHRVQSPQRDEAHTGTFS